MVQNGYNMFNRMIKIPLDGQVMAQRAMDAVQLGPQMHGPSSRMQLHQHLTAGSALEIHATKSSI